MNFYFLPQIILLLLFAITFGMALAKHGMPREPLSAWNVFYFLNVIIILLVWGGFFNGLLAAIIR